MGDSNIVIAGIDVATGPFTQVIVGWHGATRKSGSDFDWLSIGAFAVPPEQPGAAARRAIAKEARAVERGPSKTVRRLARTAAMSQAGPD